MFVGSKSLPVPTVEVLEAVAALGGVTAVLMGVVMGGIINNWVVGDRAGVGKRRNALNRFGACAGKHISVAVTHETEGSLPDLRGKVYKD